MSEPTTLPALELIGDNPTLLWGMTNAERLRRMARAEGLPDTPPASGAQLFINLDYVFDPVWLRHIVMLPGTVVMDGDALVMAHLTGGMPPDDIAVQRDALTIIDYRDNPQIYNRQLRKLDTPFIQRLTPETRREIERASYFGAYKGVTDVLTKYLWPEWALVLTRIAARIGITPNQVTASAALCILATDAFCLWLLLDRDGRRASSSWCSTPSTGSWPAARSPRRNGAMSPITGSTWSTRRSGGGSGRRVCHTGGWPMTPDLLVGPVRSRATSSSA